MNLHNLHIEYRNTQGGSNMISNDWHVIKLKITTRRVKILREGD